MGQPLKVGQQFSRVNIGNKSILEPKQELHTDSDYVHIMQLKFKD